MTRLRLRLIASSGAVVVALWLTVVMVGAGPTSPAPSRPGGVETIALVAAGDPTTSPTIAPVTAPPAPATSAPAATVPPATTPAPSSQVTVPTATTASVPAPTPAAGSVGRTPTRATTRTLPPSQRSPAPQAPPASTAPAPPTSLSAIPTGTPPPSIPALDITEPSGHVSAMFPILSVVGVGVVLLILAIQSVLTRPRRKGWTL